MRTIFAALLLAISIFFSSIKLSSQAGKNPPIQWGHQKRAGVRRRRPASSVPVRPLDSEGSFDEFSRPALANSEFSGPSESVHIPRFPLSPEREFSGYHNLPVQHLGQARLVEFPRSVQAPSGQHNQHNQHGFSGFPGQTVAAPPENQVYSHRPAIAPGRINPQPRMASPERDDSSTSSTHFK